MLNKATLIGRIGKKDSKELKNGALMSTLAIATSKRWMDTKGVHQEQTTWHHVNFFNNLADIVKRYAEVGSLVYIEGEINNKKIDQGVKEGQWHYSVTANNIKFIPSVKKETNESTFNKGKSDKSNKETIDDYEDFDDNSIPF